MNNLGLKTLITVTAIILYTTVLFHFFNELATVKHNITKTVQSTLIK